MHCDYYFHCSLLNFVFSFINKIYLFWDAYIYIYTYIYIVDPPNRRLILATQ
jgi:hypothetical protein